MNKIKTRPNRPLHRIYPQIWCEFLKFSQGSRIVSAQI
ncbi:hypothetical protein CAMRE0001_2807 [Campylobacter rectus RM3267]|uniref:Uncharacterized protein n=1 Tax=Campylobacter rectus RM3267 TaxID=553218 RepID=B9D100_CAMRE|nr:hypothetical protein CAMRE0001_2807 [Campylobacter rectus RM3267]